MRQGRRDVVAWVGSNIVPYEGELRVRLRSMAVPEQEISDIIHETYLQLTKLDSVAHIRSGRAYFFQAARTVLLMRIRHERVVRIDSMTEMQALTLADDTPGPDRQVSARMELERVRRIIADMPDRCREIFELRRIQGISQRETAERLGIPEHTVEQQVLRGLKLIRQALFDEIERSETELDTGSRLNDGTEHDRPQRH